MKCKQNELTDYSKKLQRAMEITDPTEARVLFSELVKDCKEARIKEGKSGDFETCVSIQKQSLGYFAGYYDHETRARVESLFDCEHPVFGSIKGKGPPTPEEAFNLGVQMGKKIKQRK